MRYIFIILCVFSLPLRLSVGSHSEINGQAETQKTPGRMTKECSVLMKSSRSV